MLAPWKSGRCNFRRGSHSSGGGSSGCAAPTGAAWCCPRRSSTTRSSSASPRRPFRQSATRRIIRLLRLAAGVVLCGDRWDARLSLRLPQRQRARPRSPCLRRSRVHRPGVRRFARCPRPEDRDPSARDTGAAIAGSPPARGGCCRTQRPILCRGLRSSRRAPLGDCEHTAAGRATRECSCRPRCASGKPCEAVTAIFAMPLSTLNMRAPTHLLRPPCTRRGDGTGFSARGYLPVG